MFNTGHGPFVFFEKLSGQHPPNEKGLQFTRVALKKISTFEGLPTSPEVKCRLTPAPFGADIKSQLS
jgi:hypothetical protein